MANWLNKYDQGGLVLKQKTKDNYGTKPNANAGHSTAGPGWIGEGTTNVGFKYNGAWGGTMQDGGIIVNDPNDPRLKKYQDSLNLYNKWKYKVPGGKNVPITQEEKRLFKDTETGIAPIYKQIYPGGKKEYFGNYPIPKQLVQYEAPKKEVKKTKGTKKFFIDDTEVDETTFNKIAPVKKGMAMGGSLPGATGFMYARVGAPDNGKYAKKTQASAEDGKSMPKSYWKSSEQREEYRNKLKELGKKALEEGSDEKFLLETPYHKISEGNNCINGVCGLNTAAGLKYSSPTDVDRYLGNTGFSDAVKAGKEDYYQVSGNFQVGDHIQYLNEKGAPHHSKIVYDITTDDNGNKAYHVIHNSGGETFTENVYTEADMKDMLAGKMPLTALNYSKINVYRPGYTLDKPLIDKEREAKTSPEARAALAERKELQEWDATHNPGFEYSIRPESEYYKEQPEGMKKFIEFANDDKKVTELAKKLNVGKDIVHDQLLNTFGELGQENKWADRWFGGTGGVENTFEKLFSPSNMSIGPGQIKFKTLDPELKEKFGIKKAKDLHDIDKVIPLMTAINVRNKQYMERQGEDLSTKLTGFPGTSADEIKYGVDRWVPYMYRGTITDPIAPIRKRAEQNAGEYRMSEKDREKYINKYINENVDPETLKTFDKGSYAERVYDMIDKNLKRTMPAENFEQYNELMPVTVKSKKKKDGGDISKDLKKQAEEFLAKQRNRPSMSEYTPKKGEAERLDREKLQRIEDEGKLLNRFARSKASGNLQDAIMFATDVIGAVEGAGAVKGLLNTLSNPVITRGPIPAPYKGTVLPYDNIGYKEPATGELAPYITPEFEPIPYSELPKTIYHGGPKVISDVDAIQVTREGLPIQSATSPTSRGFYATPNTWMPMEGSPNPLRDVEGFYNPRMSENAENYAMGRGDAYIHAGEFVENPRIVDWKTFSQMEPIKGLNPDFRRLSSEAAKIAEDLGIYGLRDQSEYNILNPQRVFKSFKPTYKNLGKGWEKYKTGGWLNKYK